ncbi:MAG TPA: serine/threonine-protein kinase [Nannocystaceae bacterium]|nr:serine/threonine-protein kinase [Nannocystaceae bacterium]
MADTGIVGPEPQLDPETVPDGAVTEERRSVIPGGALGRYVVLGESGRGGMGRVMRAYDPKLQREVAIKVMRARAITGETRERMVREARAMAKLSHPNVVAVYDVDDSTHGFMLVMEFVPGRTLREWLGEGARTWSEIVELFVAAGRGLAAAHGQGLLHRDFKPSNVLIGPPGAAGELSPIVKVTDFGLAKAAPTDAVEIEVGQGERDVIQLDEPWGGITQSGKVVGTPRYMAPEQHCGDRLGPASDQYSYCLALWEALTGSFPFSDSALPEEKHIGPPAWPQPTTVPRHVIDAVRRGLAVDPALRWASMTELLDELTHDPARRRRWIWLGGASALGVAALAIAAQSWAHARAERCSGAAAQLAGVWDDARRQQVGDAFAATQAVFADAMWAYVAPRLDDYASAWMTMHGEACAATTVRGEQSSEVMDLRMACLQRARLGLQAVTDVLGAADRATVQKAHELVAELPALARCGDIEALQAEVEPPGPGLATAVEGVRNRLANAAAQRGAGRYAEARAIVDAAQTEVAQIDYLPLHGEVALEDARLLAVSGAYDAAESRLQEVLRTASQSRQWDQLGEAATLLLQVVGNLRKRPAEGLHWRLLAEGLALRRGDAITMAAFHNSLGNVLEVQGKPALAEQEFRTALALRIKVIGEDHPDVARCRNNLANALMSQGAYAAAEAESRQALAVQERLLGPEHPDAALSRNNLATMLEAQGKVEESETEYRAALAIWQRALGGEHPDIALVHNNLANLLADRARYDEAELEYRTAIAIASASVGAEHPDVALYRNNLGTVFLARGDTEGALVEHRRALEIWEGALGPEHPSVATALAAIANARMTKGEYREAQVDHRRALAIREQALGPEHPAVTMSHNNLAIVAAALGDFAAAEAEHRRTLALREQLFGDDHPDVAMSRSGLAAALLSLERPQEALPLAERAWAVRKQVGIPAEQRAETAYFLARALFETGGDRARVRELAEISADGYDRAGPPFTGQRDEVRRWLGTL